MNNRRMQSQSDKRLCWAMPLVPAGIAVLGACLVPLSNYTQAEAAVFAAAAGVIVYLAGHVFIHRFLRW